MIECFRVSALDILPMLSIAPIMPNESSYYYGSSAPLILTDLDSYLDLVEIYFYNSGALYSVPLSTYSSYKLAAYLNSSFNIWQSDLYSLPRTFEAYECYEGVPCLFLLVHLNYYSDESWTMLKENPRWCPLIGLLTTLVGFTISMGLP